MCARLGWVVLHEMPLPSGRRADIMALRADGGFVCIEVKSGLRDFQTDSKWPDYRAFSDALYFAVDSDFPLSVLPPDVGVIVAHAGAAEPVRDAPPHPIAPARRRALLLRFAQLAALRLETLADPAGMADLRAALRVE